MTGNSHKLVSKVQRIADREKIDTNLSRPAPHRNIQIEMKQKIRYYLEKAAKRGLSPKNCIKFAAVNVKRWLELYHPDVPFSMD